jgi:hypothetical protein
MGPLGVEPVADGTGGTNWASLSTAGKRLRTSKLQQASPPFLAALISTLTFRSPAHEQARSLRRAQDVRKQLVAIMDRYKLDLVSGGWG